MRHLVLKLVVELDGVGDQRSREQGREGEAIIMCSVLLAARIIVDTSLHIGDMSFDEGVEFSLA